LWKVTIIFVMSFRLSVYLSACPSIRPHRTTRIPLIGFSWDLICENFSKICRKCSSFVKIWQEYRVLYTKILWQSLAELFVEWEMFPTHVVHKVKIYFIFNTFFFRKSRSLWVIWQNIIPPDRAWINLLTLDRKEAVCMPKI
jgi:hypothetical protein